ncbi:hypothetical protein MJT46_006050 [Ovis ammon polii x Ovis aries]|nr:hypothetical protein MJT46_006050 [Ovis ammon polii x Ovis aries]
MDWGQEDQATVTADLQLAGQSGRPPGDVECEKAASVEQQSPWLLSHPVIVAEEHSILTRSQRTPTPSSPRDVVPLGTPHSCSESQAAWLSLEGLCQTVTETTVWVNPHNTILRAGGSLMVSKRALVFTAWMIPLRYTSMDMGKSSPFRKSLPPSSALINPDRFFLARTRPSCWVVAEIT